MKFILAAAILLLAATAAHADQREPAPPPQDPSVATIRGDVVSGMFTNTSSRVLSINGQRIGGPMHTCRRLDLTPGPYSLTILCAGGLLPIRLDAVAGDIFVVKWQKAERDVCYVENEATGETVFRRTSHMDSRIAVYTPPRDEGTGLAILKAEEKPRRDWLLGDMEEGHIGIAAIDGENLGPDNHRAMIAPGPRAIAFDLSFKMGYGGGPQSIYAWAMIPVMLDAEPGKTYVLKYERPSSAPLDTRIITVWIENEATGEIVLPKTSVPSDLGGRWAGVQQNEKVSFPEGKGQLKHVAPKQKQWCERD